MKKRNKSCDTTAMRTKLIILTAALFTGLAFTIAKAPCWSISAKDAKITMSMPAEPQHQLSFTGLDANICFDPADLGSSEIIARIDVRSLVTEDAGLTKHLLTADFFGADKFPVIKFISTRFELNSVSGGFTAYGALAMKDSVKAVSIPFKFEGDKEKGTFKGNFEIFSGDFGVMKKSKSGSDKVVVTLEVPVTRPK
jgi:polyisoprenoid-binding protein YceI